MNKISITCEWDEATHVGNFAGTSETEFGKEEIKHNFDEFPTLFLRASPTCTSAWVGMMLSGAYAWKLIYHYREKQKQKIERENNGETNS